MSILPEVNPASSGTITSVELYFSSYARMRASNFVLDQREHPKKYILHDGLAEYQGVFIIGQGFASLAPVIVGQKTNGPDSVGKFGKGQVMK